MAMVKRRATPCLSLRLVVWNAPLISYNLVAARNRSLNAPCALACPALPHGFAERVEIRSRIRPFLSSDSEGRAHTASTCRGCQFPRCVCEVTRCLFGEVVPGALDYPVPARPSELRADDRRPDRMAPTGTRSLGQVPTARIHQSDGGPLAIPTPLDLQRHRS